MRNFEKILSYAGLKTFKGFVVEKDINPAEINHSEIKKILLVIRHQMGDMLCAVPMMRSLRSFYPSAKITLVTKKATLFEEIFKDNNSPVDEVKYYESGIESFLNLAKELKDERIDLAVVPSSVNFSGTNHLLAHMCEARIKAGVKSRDYELNPAGYVLNIKNDFAWGTKKVHQIERNLDVIRQLNITPSENSIKLGLRKENIFFAEEFYNKHFPDESKLVFGFHPGAGKEGNVWSAEKFAGLANKLQNKFSCYFFISEGPVDEKYVNETEKLLIEKYGINPVRHKGELMNNTAIISRLNLFVTNDTGVMHLASGFDVPVVALFGPTRAYEWGPVGKNRLSIQGIKENVNNIDIQSVYDASVSLLD